MREIAGGRGIAWEIVRESADVVGSGVWGCGVLLGLGAAQRSRVGHMHAGWRLRALGTEDEDATVRAKAIDDCSCTAATERGDQKAIVRAWGCSIARVADVGMMVLAVGR